MIATLYSTGQLNSPIGFTAALAVGVCFGLCLERAGFGSSRRLAGVFYFQDMTVVKVMFTAMVTAMLGLFVAERTGVLDLSSLYLMPTLLGAHAVGGAILGVGFAMAGWCPGTAAVGLGSGRVDAVVYLAGAVIGSILYNEAFPAMAPLASLGDRGVATLNYTLGMPKEYLVLAFTCVAVLFFWICEMIERGFTMSRPGVGFLFLLQFSAVLCLGAVVAINLPKSEPSAAAARPAQAGAMAQVQGSGQAGAGPQDQAALLAAVQAGLDHMEPEELARRLMAQEPGLVVVDIRTRGEFDAFHLKGARHIDMARLPAELAAHKNQGVIVLYSGGMTHPAQARDALARMGFTNVYFLTGGLAGFFERCLKPASLRDTPPSQELAADIKAWREFFLPGATAGPGVPANALALPPGCTPPCQVSAEWLAANLGKPGLKVIDLSAQPQYNTGHIPGSFSLQPDSLRGNLGGAPSMLLPGGMLAQHLSQMGVSPRDLVVIAPGQSPHDATLAAMALERLGHRRYALLSGGMKGWNAAGLPKNTLLPQASAGRYPAPEGPDGFTVDGLAVLTASKDGRTVIIDTRPADYYTGAKSDEARGGHIPGAVSRPFTEDQAKADGDALTLKPAAELEAVYARLIPAKNHPVIVHCRTGHQASQTWWVLTRLLGYTNVKYYDAGWTEWSARPEWPVATGQPQGQGQGHVQPQPQPQGQGQPQSQGQTQPQPQPQAPGARQ